MQKHIILASMALITMALSSCMKSSGTDMVIPILGNYTGTITDSDLVSHQVTNYASQSVSLYKLTSSRVNVISTEDRFPVFYADATVLASAIVCTIPGQTLDSINVQGANVEALNFPAGYTMVHLTAGKQLTFATKIDNPYNGSARISWFTGTKP